MRTFEYALLMLVVCAGVIYGAHRMSQAVAASMTHTSQCIQQPEACRR